MLVLGKDRLSLWAPADHHLGRMILKAEERKRGLEVATAVGVDPAIVVGSQARVPFGIDEFYVAGGLRGSAGKVNKCERNGVEGPGLVQIGNQGVGGSGRRGRGGGFGGKPGCYRGAEEEAGVKS